MIFRKKNEEGIVVYVATKPYFRNEAKLSIAQLQKVMPKQKIKIFTDVVSEFAGFENVSPIEIKNPENSFRDKVNALTSVKEGKVLFLDTDIYVGEDISVLFKLLDDGYEMAMAHATARMNTSQCFPDFNSGVFAFRNSKKVSSILDAWKAELLSKKNGYPDQPILSNLVYKNKVKVFTLPTELNFRGGQTAILSGKVSVVHLHWQNRFGFDNEKLFKFVNNSQNNRVFLPEEKVMIDEKNVRFEYK
ncbi:putative nucleotide-diphospho-sugar transferase [Glaciecola sp. 1036]|uniref:putative nucleotide-diphospho-sugar transferase n=1 Tax=Alteromonadaceae TaxID=72275 RepID=UPI003D06DDB9